MHSPARVEKGAERGLNKKWRSHLSGGGGKKLKVRKEKESVEEQVWTTAMEREWKQADTMWRHSRSLYCVCASCVRLGISLTVIEEGRQCSEPGISPSCSLTHWPLLPCLPKLLATPPWTVPLHRARWRYCFHLIKALAHRMFGKVLEDLCLIRFSAVSCRLEGVLRMGLSSGGLLNYFSFLWLC